jgi:hypothetical protein
MLLAAAQGIGGHSNVGYFQPLIDRGLIRLV